MRYTGLWKIIPEKINMDRKKINTIIVGWGFDW